MGRRSLPKTEPAGALAPYLVTPSSLGSRFCPLTLFGRAAPLEIEIGSGKGLFLRTASRAHTDRNFLGVEITRKYAHYIASRLARQEQANARILVGDALTFLRTVADDSVAAVHVYFPDPWWKKRHRRRRILNPTFVQSLQRILTPDGRFHFWTDVREYFESTLELMRTATQLVGPLTVEPQPALHDMDFRTHFERRVRLNELPVFRAEFCRPAWRVEIAADAQGVREFSPKEPRA